MKKIGIIGFGNMGSAIAEQLKSNYKIVVFDKDRNKIKNIKGIEVATDNIDLLKKVDIVILAIKPQDFEVVLNEIKNYTKDKLVISIAAGITTSYIETRLDKARVVRAMPNLPAKVREGMISLCKGQYTLDNDLSLTNELFSILGKTLIMNEDKMDSATAVSGSGPGFFYSLIQSSPQTRWVEFGNKEFNPKLIYAAEQVGFSAQEAIILASATTNGSIALLKATALTPNSLCLQVTSPGGTTEAGLKVLNGDIGRLSEAVKAAERRAKELSK
jgi:pyrroline-5-carboxylate reductase